MNYLIHGTDPLTIVGILDYRWGEMWDRQVIVAKNSKGEIGLASVSWLKSVCDAGRQVDGISFSRDGSIFFDMEEANLPIQSKGIR